MVRRLVYLLILVPTLAMLASCSEERPPQAYVSLGDSLAVGVGASDPVEKGYAPLYRDGLEAASGRPVELTQLGISGETSESFIGGYPGDSQLARAEETLRENPGARVTLSIGGNDLLDVAGATDAEREAAIEDYGENLDFVLKTLQEASEPEPEISVLALYNPAPGSFTDYWTGRLNAEIRNVAEANGVGVAAGDEAFVDREGRYSHHTRYPWDIHPTDEGYAALAEVFAEASFGEDR